MQISFLFRVGVASESQVGSGAGDGRRQHNAHAPFYFLSFFFARRWHRGVLALTGDSSCAPCSGSAGVNHWTSKKMPLSLLLIRQKFQRLCARLCGEESWKNVSVAASMITVSALI